MNSNEIKKRFISFFVKQKKLPHIQIESSSLVPANDPTVLFTTAGMQQLKPYFLGDAEGALKDLGSNRLTSIQKCFRVSDIDEVGDDTHLTFFEMLGNFSVGDYFKDDAIRLAWTFLTDELRLPKERLWITYFSGDQQRGIPEDLETKKIWSSLGIPDERIIALPADSNFWGPPGKTGPCGPSTEIHFDTNPEQDVAWHQSSSSRFIEIWNVVLMQYEKNDSGKLVELKQKNIDTGMGLERISAILEKKKSVFDISTFESIVKAIKKTQTFQHDDHGSRSVRIIADHLRASTFLVADHVPFGKKGQQAVLRRIFRKALDQFDQPSIDFSSIIHAVISEYAEWYPDIKKESDRIMQTLQEEQKGYVELRGKHVEEYVAKIRKHRSPEIVSDLEGPTERFLSADEVFVLLTTHGFSVDSLQKDGYSFDQVALEKKLEEHRATSKVGAEKKFGGHGLTNIGSDEVPQQEKIEITKLHTSTHLLHAALRKVLGSTVQQEGSDITPERLRFDFRFERKLTDEEKARISALVNDWIARDCVVIREFLSFDEAVAKGALAFFREKYPKEVSVYSVVDQKTREIISMELCGGPHVDHTGMIGHFSLVSEKSVAKGIRRIKAEVKA